MSILKNLAGAMMASATSAYHDGAPRKNPYSRGYISAMMDVLSLTKVKTTKRNGFRDKFLPNFAEHLQKISGWGGPPLRYAHPTCFTASEQADLHQSRINAAHEKRKRKAALRIANQNVCLGNNPVLA